MCVLTNRFAFCCAVFPGVSLKSTTRVQFLVCVSVDPGGGVGPRTDSFFILDDRMGDILSSIKPSIRYGDPDVEFQDKSSGSIAQSKAPIIIL